MTTSDRDTDHIVLLIHNRALTTKYADTTTVKT